MQAGTLAKGTVVLFIIGACLATSAEARHRRSWQGTEPAPAASQSPTDATNERRQRPDLASSARLRRSSGIAAVIDRVIRGCAQQGFELANWPFGTIAKVVAPDPDQAAALEELRIATQQAADTLTTSCPQGVPAEPAAQLEAVEQAVDAASNALAGVQPALQ